MRKTGKRVDDKPAEQEAPPASEPCKQCRGTGLVSGFIPPIDSNNCCVDYANALCPQCQGYGVIRPGGSPPE